MKHSFLFKRGEYYHLEYWDDLENKVKRLSTGRKKKSEAIKFLIDFDKEFKNQPKLKPITLREFFSIYKRYIETNLSPKYLADIKTTENKILEFAGNIPLLKLNTLLLEQFISKEASHSKHQSVKHYNNLRSALNKAISWGYLQVNPLLKIKPVKPPKNNPIFIDEKELGLILEKELDSTLRDIYFFDFHTGLRLGELINLKWNAVDLSERILKIQNTDSFTTKGKKERIIPINENLYSLLLERLPKVISINNNEYVFNKNGFRYNGDYISKSFKKCVIKAGLNNMIHLHSLRHSFASNLIMKGIPIYTVMELLGHQDVKTTQVYSHLKVDYLKQAVKVLES